MNLEWQTGVARNPRATRAGQAASALSGSGWADLLRRGGLEWADATFHCSGFERANWAMPQATVFQLGASNHDTIIKLQNW